MYDLASLQERHEEGGNAAIDALLLPVEAGLAGLPTLHLDSVQSAQLRHGQRLQVVAVPSSGLHRALDPHDQLVALVEIEANGRVRVNRGFNSVQMQVDAVEGK